MNESVEKYIFKTEGNNVKSMFTASGFSIAGQAQNQGFLVLLMKPWGCSSGCVAERLGDRGLGS